MVAILALEPEADVFADVIAEAASAGTSAIAIFEAALAIARQRRSTVEEAEQDVRDLIAATGIQVISVTDMEATQALTTFARYG